MGWRLTTAAEAPAPKPLREFDVDLTVYVKETQVVDGHGTTLLLEIVNTSGHKVRVTGPPLVRRLEAGEGQRGARAGRADATLPAGSAPMGPVAPERLPKPAEPPAGDAAPKADADPEVVSALPVVTCTLSEGAHRDRLCGAD